MLLEEFCIILHTVSVQPSVIMQPMGFYAVYFDIVYIKCIVLKYSNSWIYK